MTESFLQEYGDLPLLYAGGVISSQIIREKMEREYGGVFAEPKYSSDNAAGTGVLAAMAMEKGGVQ